MALLDKWFARGAVAVLLLIGVWWAITAYNNGIRGAERAKIESGANREAKTAETRAEAVMAPLRELREKETVIRERLIEKAAADHPEAMVQASGPAVTALLYKLYEDGNGQADTAGPHTTGDSR